MSKKNRVITELQTNIDLNFILRRNELKLYKDLVEKNAKNETGEIYSKSLIVFLYAHWEGFIKYASESFLQFISFQKLKNRELNYGLLAISNLEIVNNFLESHVALKIKALEYLMQNLEKQAEVPYGYTVGTYSKLNTETLEEICMIIGIDESYYSLKKGIIDEKLVNNRNAIAHGDLIKITPDESIEIFESVFPILESFKTDVLNKALLFKYQSK